jgi:hypothetical protein
LVPFVQRDVVIPCDPSNCVLSQLLVNGSVTANAFIANSVNPASTGLLRLEHLDQICWRNFANSGDVCLSVNASDAIQFPGGFGGGGGGTTVNINGAGVASTVNFNGTTPAATANHLNVVWQYSAGNASAALPISGNGGNVASTSGTLTSGDCAQFDASGNIIDAGAPCAAGSASLSAQTVCNLGGDILGISSATLTTVITCSTTAPSSGCPCRAFVSWNIAARGTSSTEQAEGFVTDGTNIFAGTANTIDNQVTTGYKGMDRSGWSPVRYNNSSTNVFTLKAESDHTWDIHTATFYNSLPTQVVVNYIPSN